jgi:hypothetical protein
VKTGLGMSIKNEATSKDAYKTENVKWDSFKKEFDDINIRAA